jgi:hypothetical protein
LNSLGFGNWGIEQPVIEFQGLERNVEESHERDHGGKPAKPFAMRNQPLSFFKVAFHGIHYSDRPPKTTIQREGFGFPYAGN